MDCKNCGKSMRYDRSDTSYAQGINYNREHYKCPDTEGCGTWLAWETPKPGELDEEEKS